jgi:anion-transporting  ArsA/GET3 family ATPase
MHRASFGDVVSRPLVVVTGKGGTGKSTVAGALAAAAAGAGRRVAVCELAGQRRLAGVLPAGVTHVAIDPQAALREWLRRQPGGAAAAAMLAGSSAFQHLIAAAPGATELVTVGKIADLVWSGQHDTVFVDAPATGHMVALVTAPRTYAGIAHTGRINRDATALRELLADRASTAYLGVALPEEMPVRELLDLHATLTSEIGRGLDAVVVDQCSPRRFSDADARHLRALAADARDERSRACLDAALTQHRRALAHERSVEQLRSTLDLPLAVLPQLAVDPLGTAGLAQLGELLPPAPDALRRAA